MVTFNHETWVQEAVESVLAQSFDDWEIIVADDLSTDGTVAAAEALRERCRHPDGRERLVILPHDRKFGRRPNFTRALAACRGDYVSQLDGDDWLVDEDALANHVAFLDAHPECSGVFGDWLETDVHGGNEVVTRGFHLEKKDRFDATDFAATCRAASVAVTFRSGLIGTFPDAYATADVGDWPLHFLNIVAGGPYAYVPGVVAAHRNHTEGVWTQLSGVGRTEIALRMHDFFLAHAPEDLVEPIRRRLYRWNRKRARSALKRKQKEVARLYLGWCEGHGDLCRDPLRLRWHRRRAGLA